MERKYTNKLTNKRPSLQYPLHVLLKVIFQDVLTMEVVRLVEPSQGNFGKAPHDDFADEFFF